MIREWMRDRRWRKEQPAREGWIYLLDATGCEVGRAPVLAVPSEHGKFTNERPIEFRDMRAATVTTVRLVDADGNATDTPIEDVTWL